MKKLERVVSLFTAVCIAGIYLGGCAEKQETVTNTVMEERYGDGYPIESDTVLEWWMPMNANMAAVTDSMSKLDYAIELEKRTGVKVEYIHPTLGQTTEKFNLLIASGDLPDIVEYSWGNYPGGPQKAIDDKYIMNHTEIFQKYCPNIYNFLQSNAEVDKQCKTDEGNYFGFPLITYDKPLRTSGGIVVRKDWLDDLGLAVPETIDEWHEVLTQFKNEKGATAAMSHGIAHARNGAFIGAWGIIYGFYNDGEGNILFGPAQPEYKEYLRTMAQWYQEGLIDSSFAINDDQTVSANMLNGTTAVTYAGLGGGIGKWMSAMKDDPSYRLTGAKYPVLNKGDRPQFGQFTTIANPSSTIAITTQCSDVELAAKLLDYAYGEEGHMLNNFGIEGVSYEMRDGYPTYTEVITNNPDGLSMAAALQKYSRAGAGGGFVQDIRYLEQYAGTEEQQEAWKNWQDTDAENYMLPNLYIASEDQSEFAKLGNTINTYTDEMFVKFITGVEPIEYFDTYISELQNMGLERYIQIEQEAYDRYLTR